MDLENLKIEDTAQEHMKGKNKEDTDEDAITTIEDSDEEEEEEDADNDSSSSQSESNKPLEIGGFLTPLDNKTQSPIDPAKEVLARDLSPGNAILLTPDGRPCEIAARTDTRALQGPLASRHQIALELIDLWDKETVERAVVKATEKMRRVVVERRSWEVVSEIFFVF